MYFVIIQKDFSVVIGKLKNDMVKENWKQLTQTVTHTGFEVGGINGTKRFKSYLCSQQKASTAFKGAETTFGPQLITRRSEVRVLLPQPTSR